MSWKPSAERFWSRVDQSSHGCWEYNGPTDKDGYGRYSSHRANILAYEFAYGPVPKGRQVNHSCNNELCCQPCHLYAGTQYENMQDRKVNAGFRQTAMPDECKRGHDRATHSRFYPGKKPPYVCRECEGIRRRRYRQRKKDGNV